MQTIRTASRWGVALLVASCLFHSALAAEVPQVPVDVQDLMKDRRYEDAAKRIGELIAEAKTPRDYLTYLQGRALHLAGKYDAAGAAYDKLTVDFPESPWARRARFAKGAAMARKGDFRAAELIYRKEAEFLFSLERKQEIADIYLEFAKGYFEPQDEQQKPDFAKALDFYRRALQVGPQLETRAVIELRMARCQQELGKHAEAIAGYQKFLKAYPDHVLLVEARFRLGETQLGADQKVEARRTWRDLLDLHGMSGSERLPEAAFKISLTYNLPSPASREELSLGVATLQAFLKSYPEHKLASLAHLRIAESYRHQNQHEDAVAALKAFLADARYADREELPRGRQLLGDVLRQQEKYDEALATWREFLKVHPTDKAWSAVQKAIIDTEYAKAAGRYRKKEYEAARSLWSEYLVKYPLDARNPQILLTFGVMQFAQDKWQEALADWRRLVSKYPKSNEASHAQYRIALLLETKLDDLEQALREYRKLDWGSYRAKAAQRVSLLTGKTMQIATERTFRSNEKPHVLVHTRNLEQVTVRVYQLDLETYFRKMHLARGIENLDVALIDPDESFEFSVPDYKKYKRLENKIEIPLRPADPQQPASGVTAVTISSKDQEATTLVVQSDLEVLVKSSRDEVFVFTENMRTGKAWPGARVLVSDGKRVFAEAKTGDDGVFRGEYEALKDAQDVRVFAIADAHTASNQIPLEGLGVAQGLTDKGYIYTDRPAYRPGQFVHVRGIVRNAQGDTYQVVKEAAYRLSVFDTRNRLVYDAQVQLNRFGSVRANFVLPQSSPQGTYRILLEDKEGASYQGIFQVQQYQVETVQLSVDSERTVFYRGETIQGTIEARYYYGAPLVDREIRYTLGNGRTHTARTDAEGKVPFNLDTREYREAQALPLIVALPERNLHAGKTFFLATQGFALSTRLVRSVFLAGETFELEVNAQDALGEPISQPLKLSVLRQTPEEGEVQTEEHDLKTDDKGTIRKTLRIDQGGSFILRVSGTDRFGNVIRGESTVTVSDDNDRTRLRVLANRHTYKVGEEATFKLHWREKPALAIVTFQGARILEYRLLQLQNGANELKIPITAKLAPNFELAVAVMTDSRGDGQADKPNPLRLHTATTPIQVERDLKVELSVVSAEDPTRDPRPGETVRATLKTTDTQGNPVSAEVSLAMVEQALLDRFRSPLSRIQDFFRSTPRQSAMRTTSSIAFAYRPQTRAINAALLAEVNRRTIAEREITALELLTDDVSRLQATLDRTTADNPPGTDRWNDLGTVRLRNGTAQQLGLRFDFYNGQSSAARQQWGQAQVDFDGDGEPASVYYSRAANREQEFGWRFSPTRSVYDLNYSPQLQQGQILQRDGVWFNLNLNGRTPEQSREILVRLADQDASLVADRPHETAYWNPAVQTDEQGMASVEFSLPQRSTAWNLQAKGISIATLAGEQNASLVVKKELFGQLQVPTALTDGDTTKIIASVHNQAVEDGSIDVTLKVSMGGKTTSYERKLPVTEKGITSLVFEHAVDFSDRDKAEQTGPTREALIDLTVSAGELQDQRTRVVPVFPYGMTVFSIAGGSSRGDASAVLEPPQGMPLEDRRLQVIIGPSIERSLLDALLAPPTWCQADAARVASSVDTASSDLMAAIALQKLTAATRDAAGPQAEELDARIRATISLLVSLQGEDGGWNWSGGGDSNRYSTARVVWALSMARSAGYRVVDADFDKGLQYLRNQAAAVRVDDFETKAVLLQSLAAANAGDFRLANQLYRNRQALSPSGLAHLALALATMDRKQTAGELLGLLAQKNLDAPAAELSWNHSGTELRALYALALQQVDPAEPRLKPQIDWLLAHRTGHRWSPDKATGPAVLALSRWYARSQFEGEKYRLTVFVNDKQAEQLEIEPRSRTQTIDIPDALLVKDKQQRVRFEIDGRGQFTFQCVLGGFVPGGKLKSTVANWDVERFYEPAPQEYEGREVARGFDVVQGTYKSFRNTLDQLPVGRRGHVELHIRRHNTPLLSADEQLEYLVVTEPLPAGTTVIPASIKGGFERYQLQPGAITFYLGARRSISTIRYDVHGYLPGKYRVAPTLVRNAYRPDQIAVSTPKTIEVLPQGARSADRYRLSPRELYELGKRYYQDDQLEAAAEHLGKLLKDWNLKGDIYRDSVRMLLDVHLAKGPSSEVVRYFEIIVVKYPELEIPFAQLLKVGDAYHEIGEYERSYLVFRATVEASFMRESRVAGFLESQQKYFRSVQVMDDLLREYPPESYVAAASYALAQRVYAKAPQAAKDPELREKKITRVELIRDAWTRLSNFLTAYPNDPAADEASFSLANALLDLELYEPTVQACQQFAERYPKSEFLDSYWYMIGYCHYAMGEHEEALQMCGKVAAAERKNPETGRQEESPNKWRAIYILGQIYHSLGQAENAIREYTRVRERFVDARQAIDYFAHKKISLPEVTTLKPGEPVKVELQFRNVESCDATVYRIDLMKYSVLRRNLGAITDINLSGIRPFHEAELKLGDGKDYKDRTTELKLPLKDEGAYLIVCRGGDLHASGLVVISPLKVEVREEVTSGRVRTTVRNVVSNRYVNEVHVKVIGTHNDDFVAGETDLRGIFVADGIQGNSMVIAQLGNQYAFFRGTTHLGPPMANANQNEEPSAPSAADSQGKGQLLEGLKGGNMKIQQAQEKQLQELFDNPVESGIGGGFGGGLIK